MSETGPSGMEKFFGKIGKIIERIPKDPNADLFQRQRVVSPPPIDRLISETTKPLDSIKPGLDTKQPTTEDVVVKTKFIDETGRIVEIK